MGKLNELTKCLVKKLVLLDVWINLRKYKYFECICFFVEPKEAVIIQRKVAIDDLK